MPSNARKDGCPGWGIRPSAHTDDFSDSGKRSVAGMIPHKIARMWEKGDRPPKRPVGNKGPTPITALSLLHPLSNRGHCSTFQPFNFSTAPKARAPRDSRCLPPRLLLDGNLKQEHPITQRLPMNPTNQKISRRDAVSAEREKGDSPQGVMMNLSNRSHYLVLCIAWSVVCITLFMLAWGLWEIVCRLQKTGRVFCWTSGSVLCLYIGIAVIVGWIVFLKTIKKKHDAILIWMACAFVMNILALCACFAAMTHIFCWVLPL